MGGPGKMIGKLINKATEEGVLKKVEPKLKTPEEGKKTSEALEAKLKEKEALRIKRKGRGSTIMTSSSGLNEEYEAKQKTLLG